MQERFLGIKITPLSRRQIDKFKSRKGVMCLLWLFIFVFTLSMFSEFIANDKPLLVKYDNAYYYPIIVKYSETEFGGDFESEADYRDEFVKELINEKGWMLWPPIPFSYSTIDNNLSEPAPSHPSKRHWLGTDDHGRDVVARILYGFRISVLFAIVLTFFSTIIGVIAGAVQGYFGGWIDLLAQRFMEIWSSFPMLLMLIILASFITPSFWILVGIMLLFSWMSPVDVVRAEVLRVRNFPYVMAARALGVSDWKIIIKHILPNATVAVITYLPFTLSGAITVLTSLDFMGFGLPIGSPSLGELLMQSKANIHASWLGISCFCVFAWMLTSLVLIGNAAQRAFDPRRG